MDAFNSIDVSSNFHIVHQDKDNFESPSPTSLQEIMQDHADEVIDLAGDSETTLMYHPVFVPYNNNNEVQFPLTYL